MALSIGPRSIAEIREPRQAVGYPRQRVLTTHDEFLAEKEIRRTTEYWDDPNQQAARSRQWVWRYERDIYGHAVSLALLEGVPPWLNVPALDLAARTTRG